MDLLFSPRALDDLSAMQTYIAERDSPERAEAFISGIIARCEALVGFPAIGRDRSDLRPGLRTLAARPGIIVAYDISPSHVVVLRIHSSDRDWEKDS